MIYKNKITELIGISLLATLSQFSTDIYLPSIPSLAKYFGVDINGSQLSISAYMFSLTVTQLFWGPLSDRLGRKKTLYIGLFISVFGTLICLKSEKLGFFIGGRVLQGVGNGAAAGLFRAVLRDSYTGKELASFGSYLSNLFIAILMLAPVVGGFFERYFTWKASFYFLFMWSIFCLFSLKFFIRETSKVHENPLEKKIIRSYKRLLMSRIFMGCCLSNFLTYGGLFSWITASSSILIEELKMSPLNYGVSTGFVAFGLVMGSFVNVFFVKKIGMNKMLSWGWSLITFSGFVLIISSFLFESHITMILICAFIFYFGTSFIFANTNAIAFSSFGDIAGTASGVYAFIQLLGGALASWVIASLNESGSIFLGGAFVLSGLSAWFVFSSLVLQKDVN